MSVELSFDVADITPRCVEARQVGVLAHVETATGVVVVSPRACWMRRPVYWRPPRFRSGLRRHTLVHDTLSLSCKLAAKERGGAMLRKRYHALATPRDQVLNDAPF